MDELGIYLAGNGVSAERVEHCAKRLAIRRLRSGTDGKERLEIRIYDCDIDDSRPYSTLYCGLVDLQRDLLQLRDYGVLVSRKDIMQIERILTENYYTLACSIDEGARTLTSDIPGILWHICAFIREHGISAKTFGNNELYNIPAVEFVTLFKGSDYARYRQRDIRRALRDSGYTVCSPGRYDNTVKDNGGPSIKVISLHADDPDILEIMQGIDNEQH